MNIFSLLPKDLLIQILLFDDRFIIKNSSILKYNKISYNDFRYQIINLIPKKYYNNNTNCWEVKLNLKKSNIINNKPYKESKFFILSLMNNSSIDLECLLEVGFSNAFIYKSMERYIL